MGISIHQRTFRKLPGLEYNLHHFIKKRSEAKIYKSELPPRRTEIQLQTTSRNNTNYGYNNNQQQNLRKHQHINAQRVENIQTARTISEEDENETEIIDPKSTLLRRELTEEWNSVNFIISLNFTTKHTKTVNKN